MTPIFEVTYEGVNITSEISSRLVALTYTDKIAGEIDEVQITLENADDLWISDWMPEMGDLVDVLIGYPGNTLDCGTFAVDEITTQSPPSTVTLKCLAASRKSTLRTKVSRAYEGQSLRQIAQSIADRQGLELVDQFVTTRTTVSFSDERDELLRTTSVIRGVGISVRFSNIAAVTQLAAAARSIRDKGNNEGQRILDEIEVLRRWPVPVSVSQINAALAAIERFLTMVERIARDLEDRTFESSRSRLESVRISRATQNRESDLSFLNRIGRKYGYYFSVRGNQLIFIYYASINEQPPIREYSPRNIKRWSITRKSTGTYSKVSAAHLDPSTGEDVQYLSDYLGPEDVANDTLALRDRYESAQQAQEAADAALAQANNKATEGAIVIVGDPAVISGVNITVQGIGRYSGVFTTAETTHTITKSGGYETSAAINRVRR